GGSLSFLFFGTFSRAKETTQIWFCSVLEQYQELDNPCVSVCPRAVRVWASGFFHYQRDKLKNVNGTHSQGFGSLEFMFAHQQVTGFLLTNGPKEGIRTFRNCFQKL
ncbi:hypothetical protein M5D96_010267, partial [Drosophila gunungcola]